ncbi:hypothetical protein DPMN_033689 [Dreissena polymorpha]|uniref:Uncharacterized protein n=1 Tax=Dreissena polymorpha TaxID=45954 RepID=A0A9D4M6H9_DREPO|nr:hypothetical protein DPMN_033689 [Dreissena polymorpha]
MDKNQQRSTRCTRPVKIGIGVFVAAVVIAVVVIVLVGVASNKDTGETPTPEFEFEEICVVEPPSLRKQVKITCDFRDTANVDPDIRDKLKAATIDAAATTVKLNGRDDLFKFTCSGKTNMITCFGPKVTCSFKGMLDISIIDSKGHDVFSNKTYIAVAEKTLVTNITQTFSDDVNNITSNFTLICGAREVCEDVHVEVYLENTSLINKHNVQMKCLNTSKSDTHGYDITCEYVVGSEMIKSLSSLNLTCVSWGNNSVVRQQELFELPVCWEKSNTCNCSQPRDTCKGMCDILTSCGTRHVQLKNPVNTECSTECFPKWCRSRNNSLLTDTNNILLSVCEL